MLQELVDKSIIVRLKWGQTEYKGKLVAIDSYMNLQLSGTEEYISDKLTGELGQVLIRYVKALGLVLNYLLPSIFHSSDTDVASLRCNNVLWIRGAGQGERSDIKMEG